MEKHHFVIKKLSVKSSDGIGNIGSPGQARG